MRSLTMLKKKKRYYFKHKINNNIYQYSTIIVEKTVDFSPQIMTSEIKGLCLPCILLLLHFC